jgi:hypothetical protein
MLNLLEPSDRKTVRRLKVGAPPLLAKNARRREAAAEYKVGRTDCLEDPLKHNTTVAHLALTVLFAGCAHSSSQDLNPEESAYEQQPHGNHQVRSPGTADASYDEPKYKIALSEVLEKAPTRNAAKYMRNAFELGVSAGRLDSLPFEFRNANSYANMGCSAAAIRLLKVGKSLDLSYCEGLEDPRFREATIPGQGYADSRLAVVNQFRGDPDAVTFQLLANGKALDTRDRLARAMEFWRRREPALGRRCDVAGEDLGDCGGWLGHGGRGGARSCHEHVRLGFGAGIFSRVADLANTLSETRRPALGRSQRSDPDPSTNAIGVFRKSRRLTAQRSAVESRCGPGARSRCPTCRCS